MIPQTLRALIFDTQQFQILDKDIPDSSSKSLKIVHFYPPKFNIHITITPHGLHNDSHSFK